MPTSMGTPMGPQGPGLYSQPSIVKRMMDQNLRDVDPKDAAVLLPRLLLQSESLDLGQMPIWSPSASSSSATSGSSHRNHVSPGCALLAPADTTATSSKGATTPLAAAVGHRPQQYALRGSPMDSLLLTAAVSQPAKRPHSAQQHQASKLAPVPHTRACAAPAEPAAAAVSPRPDAGVGSNCNPGWQPGQNSGGGAGRRHLDPFCSMAAQAAAASTPPVRTQAVCTLPESISLKEGDFCCRRLADSFKEEDCGTPLAPAATGAAASKPPAVVVDVHERNGKHSNMSKKAAGPAGECYAACSDTAYHGSSSAYDDSCSSAQHRRGGHSPSRASPAPPTTPPATAACRPSEDKFQSTLQPTAKAFTPSSGFGASSACSWPTGSSSGGKDTSASSSMYAKGTAACATGSSTSSTFRFNLNVTAAGHCFSVGGSTQPPTVSPPSTSTGSADAAPSKGQDQGRSRTPGHTKPPAAEPNKPRRGRRSSPTNIPSKPAASTAATKPAGSNSNRRRVPDGPPSPATAMAKLHVLHARKKMPCVHKDLVKRLVNAQLQTKEPIRAPWYRPARSSSTTTTSSSSSSNDGAAAAIGSAHGYSTTLEGARGVAAAGGYMAGLTARAADVRSNAAGSSSCRPSSCHPAGLSSPVPSANLQKNTPRRATGHHIRESSAASASASAPAPAPPGSERNAKGSSSEASKQQGSGSAGAADRGSPQQPAAATEGRRGQAQGQAPSPKGTAAGRGSDCLRSGCSNRDQSKASRGQGSMSLKFSTAPDSPQRRTPSAFGAGKAAGAVQAHASAGSGTDAWPSAGAGAGGNRSSRDGRGRLQSSGSGGDQQQRVMCRPTRGTGVYLPPTLRVQ